MSATAEAVPVPAATDPRGASPMAVRALAPERLFDHADRMLRAARSLCSSPADADDLVQETFARVLAQPRELRGGDEAGYLLRALRNTHISERRSCTRRPARYSPTGEEIDRALDRGADPDVVAHAHEVLAAISRLPAPFRDAVVAVDVNGLSYAEAARALEVRQGTIMSRLSRGRDRLARALGAA